MGNRYISVDRPAKRDIGWELIGLSFRKAEHRPLTQLSCSSAGL
jgi:hypothetical protein